MSQEDTASTAGRRSERVSNTAHNSTVGMMAGSVNGSSVHMNTDRKAPRPVDLVAELDGFREPLKRHHAEGALDDDTYREALVELGSARREAREKTPESARRATMALKRLRGLVAESPALVATLAPLVVAAGELS